MRLARGNRVARLPRRLGSAPGSGSTAGMAPSSLAGLVTAAREWLGWHRRLVAAGCIGVAVTFVVSALAPSPAPTAPVVVAAHDLSAGARLTASDVVVRAFPVDAVPAGASRAARELVGSALAGPVRRGEPLTDARLAGGKGPAPGPGQVATPVRLADHAVAALLRPGRHVDVLAAAAAVDAAVPAPAPVTPAPDPAAARVVASDVLVLDVPPPATDQAGSPSADGTLVVIATTPAQARALAQAAVDARLSVTLLD